MNHFLDQRGWMMPSHKEDATLFSPVREFQYVGGFQNAVAVINNLVARATTQWNLEESKLFILSVSQIEQRDKDCWIKTILKFQ